MSTKPETQKGPIAWMGRNGVAANLLMLVIAFAGLIGMKRVTQEVFPEFELDAVQVSVAYPGASPEEIDRGIVRVVEERLQGVDGVKRVTSNSSEGVGSVSAELLLDADKDRVLGDIKNEIDGIRTFPLDAEDPRVSLVNAPREVVSLVIAGDQEMRTLHSLAEEARVRLLASPDITQVEIQGVPPLEVGVEIDRDTLRSYGLTLDEVARQIGAASLELPGGELDTRTGKVLVRVNDRAESGAAFSEILIRSTATGAEVRLSDIATVVDGFEDNDQASFYDGKPAVRLVAYRVGDETPASVAAATRQVQEELTAEWPSNIQLAVWNDTSVSLDERIDLLLRNAKVGLLLVFLVLALFLDLRLAFWVAIGIPITFLGTFALMPALGLTVNMVTLFAFIVTLGLVVDDAIVVGEEAYEQNQLGLPWKEAAIAGAKRMAIPVTFAILTTFAAFAPLLMVPGFMGKIFGLIPAIAITVLFFSLVESFFILPAHLSHKGGFFELGIFKPVHRARELVAAALKRFIYKRFAPVLQAVLDYRRLALGVAIAVFAMTVGLVARGVVPFSFFPKLEGDVVTASARLPYGAPLAETASVQAAFEASLAQITEEYGAEHIKGTFTRLGSQPAGGGPGGGAAQAGSHLVSVEVNLVSSGEREFSSNEFAAAWAEATPELILPETYSFSGASGPGAGAAVDVIVSHPDEAVLAQASEDVAELLRSYPELTDIENGYAAGKMQLDYEPTDLAQNLNLNTQAIGAQVRGGFYGVEALREQRGRNEVKVMVRLPEEQRDSQADLGMLRIRTPGGGDVPLEYVAEAERGTAPTSIKREDAARIVNVKAELASGVRSSTEVVASLTDVEFAKLEEKYPGLSLDFSGSQRNQAEVFGSLGPNYLMALFAIYALLAIPFRSYIQPAIIMTAIPFGFVGAVLGHLLMGFELSIISMFGLVALTGVVVNDSLVLIDAANRRRAAGASALEAIIFGATRRFRPILLTSLTTFMGLAPMIAEQSVQARFLIPMAISLGFGVLFATIIVLLLIPALYMLVEDLRAFLSRVWDFISRLVQPKKAPAQALVEAEAAHE